MVGHGYPVQADDEDLERYYKRFVDYLELNAYAQDINKSLNAKYNGFLSSKAANWRAPIHNILQVSIPSTSSLPSKHFFTTILKPHATKSEYATKQSWGNKSNRTCFSLPPQGHGTRAKPLTVNHTIAQELQALAGIWTKF
mmetsp:Transcript_13198/g.31647  ORF Transcript_13198/g.31647 Transcript_13198/m.31647 type:complete len:141 (+) Transcript_13198:157-579(+)